MDNGACSYRRFLDGDEEAFDEIMEEIFPSLVVFIDKYVRDIYAAEDIAMDVFSDLIVHKKRYNFKVSLKTYLFMVGRSRGLDYIKYKKRHMTEELFEELPVKAYDDDPYESLVRGEKYQRINKAIEELPEEMKMAVYLVYYEDMSYDEAAKIMGKGRKQIDNLLFRAKKELRAIFGEKGELL